MKRILAIVLLVIIAIIPTLAVSAYSEDTADLGAKTFTPRLTAPSKSNEYYYSSKNVLYAAGYGMPNCTAYAWGRAYEILGTKPKLCANDAGSWYGYNKYYNYYSYGKTPKVGAVACWDNSWGGHVAVVEKIEGDTVTLSHSEWGGRTFFTTTHKLGAANGGATSYGWTFQGYIYVYDGEYVPDGDVYRVTSSNGINMRKGAGTSYATVDVLSYNTEFTVKETKNADGYTWGKTTVGSVTGWCALDFCKLVYKCPEETKPTEPETTVPETTVPEVTEPDATEDEIPNTTLPDDMIESTSPVLPDKFPAGYGDVNGDGKVTIADVTLIQKFIAGMGLSIEEIYADVTGDGKITVADATYIQKFLAGLVALQ